MKHFFLELRRRKVYRVAVAYAVVGFGVAGGADYLFGLTDMTDAAARQASQIVLVVVILGWPVALLLAWAYDLRPDEGPAPEPTNSSSPRLSPTAVPSPGTSVPPSRTGASIVILPFDNISPDPSDAYLSEGITEEITASLSALRALRVTSRTSAGVVKQAGMDVRSIREELGVAYVLEGSVRKVGDTLRVTAQLIRAETDEHLWSERYDGTLEDVFGMQEMVARSIVRTLELHLEPDEARRIAARPMDDPQAYESYLRAREASRLGPREALERALAHLEEARSRVGENAVILAGIGYAYSQFANRGEQDRDYIALAEEHARRALEIDPENPEAHMVLGFLYQEGLGDIDLSIHHLQRSLAVKPDDPHTLTWWIIALSLVGRNDEMTAAAERIMEVDPLNPVSQALRGYARQVRGELVGYLEDMEAWHRALPPASAGSVFHAHALAMLGRVEEARTILADEFAGDGRGWEFDMAGTIAAALDRDAERMAAVAPLKPGAKMTRDLQLAVYVTTLYALAELPDETLRWMRFVIQQGFRNYPWLAEHDPWISAYRMDPRFAEVFETLRSAWSGGGGNDPERAESAT